MLQPISADQLYEQVVKQPTAAQAFQPLPPLTDVGGSLVSGVPTGPSIVAGSTDLGSGYVLGLITAMNIQVGQLSAITANVGNLIVNTGGSISSGQTAYNTGAGFWLSTDNSGNPQFSLRDTEGNSINIQATGSNVLSISSTGITGALTSKQVDDQGWSQQAVWLNVTGQPTNLAGYGILDGQTTLPNAPGVGYVFQRDNSGSIYVAPKYGSEMNGGNSPFTASQNLTSTSYVTLGQILGFPQPSGTVNALVVVSFDTATTSGTETLGLHLDYSVNGGATWTTAFTDNMPITTVFQRYAFQKFISGLTCTGDLQFRVQGANASGVNTIQVNTGELSALVVPNANFYTTVGSLTVTVPSTGAGNCIAAFPATTCTATNNVTASINGGVAPFTFSWAKISGTGSITAGSTSQTCTVSDTETATSGGANFNTVVACTVGDATSQTPTAGTAAANVATLTFAANTIPVGATINISGCTPAAYNVTGATVTASTATTIKYAIGSTPGNMTGFGTVNNQKVTSGNCTLTNTFTLGYAAITATVSVSNGSCTTSTCGNTCTAGGTATANASGGNGSYTYSWTVTSGTGSIVSGATSKTCSVQDTEATVQSPGTVFTTTVQCAVNDSRGTGSVNANGNVKLRFSCPAM